MVAALSAVSYTHLDVYKRQAVHLAIRDARPDAVPGMFAPKLPLLGSHTRSVDGDYRAIPWESLVDLSLIHI